MSSSAPPQMNQPTPPPPGGQGPMPTEQTQQGLPPTGLQQQMTSLNNYYQQVQNAQVAQTGMGFNSTRGIGFDPRQQQFQTAQSNLGGQGLQGGGGGSMQVGSSSLDQLAQNLAQRYGLPIGRGRLVDESGNFLHTPQQLAEASGGSMTMGEAAATMNYISQAIARRQNEQQQQKGIAAMQTGLGQVQSRGRGSMASMMSGYYQGIADLYANQEYEAADFSYYIQKEQMDIANELQRRAEKTQRRQARSGVVTGAIMTIAGLYTGNVGMVAAGAAQVGGNAEGTGWF